MTIRQVCRLLAFTVPTSWSLVLGWKAGAILGGTTGLVIGLTLGWACDKAIVATVRYLMKPVRGDIHTPLYWMVMLSLMYLAIVLWIIGCTFAGVALTQFLMRNQ